MTERKRAVRRLLDDLCEVQAFLQQRVTEAAGSTGDAVPASAPQELQQVPLPPAGHMWTLPRLMVKF